MFALPVIYLFIFTITLQSNDNVKMNDNVKGVGSSYVTFGSSCLFIYIVVFFFILYINFYSICFFSESLTKTALRLFCMLKHTGKLTLKNLESYCSHTIVFGHRIEWNYKNPWHGTEHQTSDRYCQGIDGEVVHLTPNKPNIYPSRGTDQKQS